MFFVCNECFHSCVCFVLFTSHELKVGHWTLKNAARLVAAHPHAQKIIEVIHAMSYHSLGSTMGDWLLSVMLKVFPGASNGAWRHNIITQVCWVCMVFFRNTLFYIHEGNAPTLHLEFILDSTIQNTATLIFLNFRIQNAFL